MAYNYIDESRREHATALPDVEVFESRARVCSLCNERTFADPVTGCFPPESWACEDCRSDQYEPEAGWYYANLDGGLDGWSSEPSGPYPTEAAALAAAREAATTRKRSVAVGWLGASPIPKPAHGGAAITTSGVARTARV